MFRLPLSNPYRAYPELDGYTNEQCEFLMRRIGVIRKRRTFQTGCLGSLVMVLSIVAMCGLFGLLIPWIEKLMNRLVGPPMTGFDDLLHGIPIVIFFSALFLVVALIGHVFENRAIRLALAEQLSLAEKVEMARCIDCKYPLRGLPSREGQLCCPECGREHPLAELGLTQEDVLSLIAGATEAS